MDSDSSDQTDFPSEVPPNHANRAARTEQGPPRLGTIFKRAPISCLCVLTLIALFALVEIDRARVGANQGHIVMQNWGMAPGLQSVPEPELQGPFDLWDGDWWRIPVSVFHHGGTQSRTRLLTLLMVCAAIGYLGYWIEPLFPWFWYLWMLLVSGTLCLLSEFLLGHTFNGATGMGWGLFGALLVLRPLDRRLSNRFTLRTLRTAWLVLIVSLSLQLFGDEPLPAVGWLVAASFGWCTAKVRLDPPVRPFSAILGYALAHLLFYVGFHYATHPEWDGRYHWYLAVHGDVEDPIAELQKAVDCNPKLAGAWLHLAANTYIKGDLEQSWKLVLEGLERNRSSDKLQKLAQEIWLTMTIADKTENGLATLNEVFKTEADHWRKFLKLDEQRLRIPRIVFDEPEPKPLLNPEEEFALDQQLILPPFPGNENLGEDTTPPNAPEVDPEAPTSAMEGVAL